MHGAGFKFQSHSKTVQNDLFWVSSIQMRYLREGGRRGGRKVLGLEKRRKQAQQAGRPWKLAQAFPSSLPLILLFAGTVVAMETRGTLGS